jgi:hypothetical protein
MIRHGSHVSVNAGRVRDHQPGPTCRCTARRVLAIVRAEIQRTGI